MNYYTCEKCGTFLNVHPATLMSSAHVVICSSCLRDWDELIRAKPETKRMNGLRIYLSKDNLSLDEIKYFYGEYLDLETEMGKIARNWLEEKKDAKDNT